MPLLVSWNVLCWNVRGLNSDGKQLALSNAIVSSGRAVVCLQETKSYLLICHLLSPVALVDLTNLHLCLLEAHRVVLPPFGTVPFSL